MKIESFKAGEWRQRYKYRSFKPRHVNEEWTWDDPAINTLLEAATRALAELNAFSLIVPDVDRFIRMHVVKEAQTSSRIEGTQTGIDEALMREDQIDPERRDDWREVQNYIDAVNEAVSKLDRLPLSNRLLRDTHAILMRGVRGQHKSPGEFRRTQNWIGGSSLTDATFIPPHQDEVPELMADLERFWHNENIQVPHLVRAAISHYQFETIHPFLDGNGRIGRLLMPLYFISHDLLDKPSLYLSDFFERHRAHYYDALMRVRLADDLGHWVRFFLTGVAETATKGRDVFRTILALRTEADSAVMGLGKRAPTARAVLDLFYQRPILTSGDLVASLDITSPTANAVLGELRKLHLVKEITGRQWGRAYAFERYIGLFKM
ncbi:Fic/DOC family N-terminal domain-containing protein [Enterovirga aerilata]|uniref:Fic family protein n=1 Tax=Enterovirga aerilata TaxID=2730920 RepID=A0A849IBF0_9HYPH|nr:Fic family protein [Enterovirga sp. DB1703]